jgi:hypothetical protein
MSPVLSFASIATTRLPHLADGLDDAPVHKNNILKRFSPPRPPTPTRSQYTLTLSFPHRSHVQRIAGTFGTLVIEMPSAYSGSQLRVFSPSSMDESQAFFGAPGAHEQMVEGDGLLFMQVRDTVCIRERMGILVYMIMLVMLVIIAG